MSKICPGIDGNGCPKKYATNDSSHYNRHVTKCGIGPGSGGKRAGTGGQRPGTGGKRAGAGSGGRRAGAGRPSKDPAKESRASAFKTPKQIDAEHQSDVLKTVTNYLYNGMNRATCACCNELYCLLRPTVGINLDSEAEFVNASPDVLKIVDKYFNDGNMNPSTCNCCDHLYDLKYYHRDRTTVSGQTFSHWKTIRLGKRTRTGRPSEDPSEHIRSSVPRISKQITIRQRASAAPRKRPG